MRHVAVGLELEAFRETARALLAQGVRPDQVLLEPEAPQLALATLAPEVVSSVAGGASTGPAASPARVPRAFLELAEEVAAHRDPSRWNLLYEVLFRLTHGEPRLLQDPSSPPVLSLLRLQRAVRNDVHKTHAFVRFRRVEEGGNEYFIAWHEPHHRTLALAAPHFVRRFATMRWSILTPEATATWDLETLRFLPGVPRSEAPTEDGLETLWRTYYASVFNPARLNVRAMQQEMPRRHWKTLPEASLLPQLIHDAPRRTGAMTRTPEASPASALVPPEAGVQQLRHAALSCLLCPWAAGSTQTVFGEGPARAQVMLVGEQPGDQEDLQGHPFVGPAGQLLDTLLTEAGLPRDQLYVTNAVKHFKYTQSGKRRLHEKPSARDVHTCKGWLEAEVRAVQPRIIVALGATAGQAFLGPTFRLTRSRGEFMETPWTSQWMATYHPSALLRAPSEEARQQMTDAVRQDLAKVAMALREG